MPLERRLPSIIAVYVYDVAARA